MEPGTPVRIIAGDNEGRTGTIVSTTTTGKSYYVKIPGFQHSKCLRASSVIAIANPEAHPHRSSSRRPAATTTTMATTRPPTATTTGPTATRHHSRPTTSTPSSTTRQLKVGLLTRLCEEISKLRLEVSIIRSGLYGVGTSTADEEVEGDEEFYDVIPVSP